MNGQEITKDCLREDGTLDPFRTRQWMEGASDRILKLESDIKSQRFNFWALVFIIFGMPYVLRLIGVF